MARSPESGGPLRRALRNLAQFSGTLPLAAMAFGLLVPAAATALFGGLAWVSAASVFCGLMAVESGRGAGADWRAAARLLPAISVCAAAAAWATGRLVLGASPAEAAWMALIAAAPASAVSVANAAAMGLPARPVALLGLLGTLTAPLVLPLVAWAFAAGTPIEPLEVARSAVVVVLAPAVLAFALRRSRRFGGAANGAANGASDGWAVLTRADWKGIAALSVAALALSRMHGVGPQLLADPAAAGWAVLLGCVACGTGAGLAVVAGAADPWPGGWRSAALAGGAKSGALVWALTAPYLPPAGHLFMALTVLPIYGLPPLVWATLGRRPTSASPAGITPPATG